MNAHHLKHIWAFKTDFFLFQQKKVWFVDWCKMEKLLRNIKINLNFVIFSSAKYSQCANTENASSLMYVLYHMIGFISIQDCFAILILLKKSDFFLFLLRKWLRNKGCQECVTNFLDLLIAWKSNHSRNVYHRQDEFKSIKFDGHIIKYIMLCWPYMSEFEFKIRSILFDDKQQHNEKSKCIVYLTMKRLKLCKLLHHNKSVFQLQAYVSKYKKSKQWRYKKVAN